MDVLHIEETLCVSRIVWIRSLIEAELGPSRRIIEDLEILALAGGIEIKEVAVDDQAALLDLLGTIAHEATQGVRPLLHFDCHGSADEGLILANGQRLHWDVLADALRAINVATGNNLVCVFATCFGLHLGKTLTLSKPTPWYLMIAPEGEVTLDLLQTKTVPFYKAIQTSGNITQAHAQTFAPELQLLNCQKLFARSLARYVATEGSVRAISERTEALVTRSLADKGVTGNRDLVRKERSRIKRALKPSQKLIDRFAPIFLIGRKPRLTFEELNRLAAIERRSR